MRRLYIVLITILELYLLTQLQVWVYINKVFFPTRGNCLRI